MHFVVSNSPLLSYKAHHEGREGHEVQKAIIGAIHRALHSAKSNEIRMYKRNFFISCTSLFELNIRQYELHTPAAVICIDLRLIGDVESLGL